jgi:hypothetical protein
MYTDNVWGEILHESNLVEWWISTYGRNATGGREWTGRRRLDAGVDLVAPVLLAVRPGPVGPDNAAMLHGSFWSRLHLVGGPGRYVGKLNGSSVLVETDPERRTLALQGRLGWRIVTRLEPDGSGTVVVRHIQHLSPAKRILVPLLQSTRLGLRGDVRRLSAAVRRHRTAAAETRTSAP